MNKYYSKRNLVFETTIVKSVANASKMLGIKKVDVDFVSSNFIGGKTITSMYLPDHNLILFNQDWLTIAKLEDVIMTTFHETRHAYQKSQIDGIPNDINNELQEAIKIWEIQFENYFKPNDESDTEPKYVEQKIVKDAVGYSGSLLNGLIRQNYLLRWYKNYLI